MWEAASAQKYNLNGMCQLVHCEMQAISQTQGGAQFISRCAHVCYSNIA